MFCFKQSWVRCSISQYARQSAVYRTQGFIMQSGQKSENKVSSVTVQFSILYSWSGLIVQIMLVCDKQQQMKRNVGEVVFEAVVVQGL